jgi:A/G-specific adenine glycosylase
MNASRIIASLTDLTYENLNLSKIDWFRRKLSIWADFNLRDFPWRRNTEPYAIFIAECLLQKTEANTVAPIYQNFLDRYPTIESSIEADTAELDRILQPLGLRFRADRIYRSALIIVDRYQGKIPKSETELQKLPGIGKYTARAICSQAFSQPLAVLDTNVARILERFFGIRGERVKSRCKILWQAADMVAPKRKVARWNLTLLDFGAIVCKPNPDCDRCPIASQCNFVKEIR